MYIVRFLHQTTTTVRPYYLLPALYIVRFLHQTTTWKRILIAYQGCISSVSYIKPQPGEDGKVVLSGCISSVSYIKPQLRQAFTRAVEVVYRPFPTSNHNLPFVRSMPMNVVYRPFPTSNHNSFSLALIFLVLYIVRFLHQTTTHDRFCSHR